MYWFFDDMFSLHRIILYLILDYAKIQKSGQNIKLCLFFCRVLRLEFCHDLCEYYTELDAVCLHGEDSQGNYIMSGLEGVTSRSHLEDISNMEEKLDQLSLREQVQ